MFRRRKPRYCRWKYCGEALQDDTIVVPHDEYTGEETEVRPRVVKCSEAGTYGSSIKHDAWKQGLFGWWWRYYP